MAQDQVLPHDRTIESSTQNEKKKAQIHAQDQTSTDGESGLAGASSNAHVVPVGIVEQLFPSNFNPEDNILDDGMDHGSINTRIDGVSGLVGIPPDDSNDLPMASSNKVQEDLDRLLSSIQDSDFDLPINVLHPSNGSLLPSTATVPISGEFSNNGSPSNLYQLSDLSSSNLSHSSFTTLERSPVVGSPYQPPTGFSNQANNNRLIIPSPFIEYATTPLINTWATLLHSNSIQIPHQSANELQLFLNPTDLLNPFNENVPSNSNELLAEFDCGPTENLHDQATASQETMASSSGLFAAPASLMTNPAFLPSSSLTTNVVGTSSTDGIPNIVTSFDDLTLLPSTPSQFNGASSSSLASAPLPLTSSQLNSSFSSDLAVASPLLPFTSSQLNHPSLDISSHGNPFASSNLVVPEFEFPTGSLHTRSRSDSYCMRTPSHNTTSRRSTTSRSHPTQNNYSPRLEALVENIRRITQPKRLNKVETEDGMCFQCPFQGCGKTFSRTFNLRVHYRIDHTGMEGKESPFGCEDCGARFKRKADMTRHRNSHQPVQPFVCPYCNKGFNRRDALHRHLQPTPSGRLTDCARRSQLEENGSRGLPQFEINVVSSSSNAASQPQPPSQSSTATLGDLSWTAIPALPQEQIQALHDANEDSTLPGSVDQDVAEAEPSSASLMQEFEDSIQGIQQGVAPDGWDSSDFDQFTAFAEENDHSNF